MKITGCCLVWLARATCCISWSVMVAALPLLLRAPLVLAPLVLAALSVALAMSSSPFGCFTSAAGSRWSALRRVPFLEELPGRNLPEAALQHATDQPRLCAVEADQDGGRIAIMIGDVEQPRVALDQRIALVQR